MKKKGFTMIELLIVVAVLGILAVAVLAAINPIEQINRGKDTGSRSDSEQSIGGIDRFYTVSGYYPWEKGSGVDDTCPAQDWQTVDDTWIANCNTGSVTVLQQLSAAGTAELKLSFIKRITDPGYNYLQVYNRGTQGDSTYVCFMPKSASFETEAADRCRDGLPADLNAIVDTVCPGGADACRDAKTCWSCLP